VAQLDPSSELHRILMNTIHVWHVITSGIL